MTGTDPRAGTETNAGPARASRRAVLAAGAGGIATSVSLAGCADRLSGALETFDGSVDIDPTLATDDPSWPVVHGNPANARAVSATVAPEPPLSLEWVDDYETIAGHVHPVGRDGRVVGSNWEDDLSVLEAETGERAWTVTDGDIDETGFEPSTEPIITDDAVVIGTRSALWAFDRTTGAQRWRTDEPVSLGILRPGPTADGDLAFVGTPLGVAAHDLESGEREWKRRVGLRPTAVPAIRDGTVYLGGGDATLHALERDTGAVRWRSNADGSISAGPVAAESGVYVGTNPGTVIAYDRDGTERWRTAVGGGVETLAVGNGIVCAATNDDALTVVDPETGDRVWRWDRYAKSHADGPVIGGRWVFATTGPAFGRSSGTRSDQMIGAFDAETGRLEWELDDPGFKSGPAVIDGALYVTGRIGEPSGLAKLS